MMKKLTVLFYLILGFSVSVSAQQVVQQDIDVNAHVIAKLAIVSSQNVDMGTIVTGTESVLLANSADATPVTNAGSGATPGRIVISGATGERISVTYAMATLANASGNSVGFLPRVFSSSNSVISGSEITLTSGTITLDIGGMLDIVPDGEEGDYSTTNTGGSPITFTFTYTSI